MKRAECLELLASLMEKETPTSKLAEELKAAIHRAPFKYLSGLQGAGRMAEDVFQQLEPQLSEAIHGKLFGCSLNRKRCIACLELLITAAKEPDEVVTEFLKVFQSKPSELIDGYDEFVVMMKEVRSSAPYSAARSEARQE